MIIRALIALVLIPIPVLAQATQPTRVKIEASEEIQLTSRATTQPATPERDDGTGRFRNVSQPMMFVWPAPNPNGTAIIACPGGAYDHVTMELEAQRIAKWLNPMGVTVFGLKYHTRPPSTDVGADAMADGQAAVKLVRSKAVVWKIDPNKIGLLGYSAGSNLALNVASHFDKETRPDFVVLLCCWPNSGPSGRQTIADFPLSKDSPPAFIAHARDDRTAPPAFGQSIKAKYDELNVPAELFMCDLGGHGAFHLDEPNVNLEWKKPFIEWMTKRGLLKP